MDCVSTAQPPRSLKFSHSTNTVAASIAGMNVMRLKTFPNLPSCFSSANYTNNNAQSATAPQNLTVMPTPPMVRSLSASGAEEASSASRASDETTSNWWTYTKRPTYLVRA